ncbi:hypothetical protein A4A49_57980, partial [Nicotiana attenuata]
IMMMTPIPNIDKAYSLLLQEERQRSIQPTMNSPMDSSSFNASTQKFGQYSGQSKMNFNLNTGGGKRNNTAKGSDRRNMFCSYCQRAGHTIERCFKIHGYPNRNAVSTEEEFGNVQQYNQGIQQHNSSSIMGINQEQYSQLMEILQQVKIGQQAASSSEVNVTANCAGIAPMLPSLLPNKSFIHSWILASGASEHMTFDKSILFDIITLTQPLFV